MHRQPINLFLSALLISLSLAGASCRTASSEQQPVAAFKGESPAAAKKLYREMSDDEKRQFVSSEADKILQIIGGGNESAISPAGEAMIKNYVDGYAKRQTDNSEAINFCDSRNWVKSNLTAVLERGTKVAPAIAAAFENQGFAPHVGIYTAMIESEFCPCVQSPTGTAGFFQFARYAAKDVGLKVTENVAQPDESDDRCRIEPASRGAAAFFKMTAKRLTDEPNRTTLLVAAWNSGVGSLNKNVQTVKTANGDAPVSFWTLLENKDKLTAQFQIENSKYVPKFFAAAIVGENPAVFGVQAAPLAGAAKQVKPSATAAPQKTNAEPVASVSTEFWEKQRRKAREQRNAETGSAAAGLKIPDELASRSLRTQLLKINQLGLELPKDFFALAEMLQSGKAVEIPLATEDYVLDQIGTGAGDEPFAAYNAETREKIAPEPDRLAELRKIADNLGGQKYDLDDPADRRELRRRLMRSLAPEARTVLAETARAYRERFNRPLLVTSLIRPIDYQHELAKSNPDLTRSDKPPHSTGMAFDLAIVQMTAEEQNFVMAKLAELERAGKIEALIEGKNALHVFVFPDGKPPQQ